MGSEEKEATECCVPNYIFSNSLTHYQPRKRSSQDSYQNYLWINWVCGGRHTDKTPSPPPDQALRTCSTQFNIWSISRKITQELRDSASRLWHTIYTKHPIAERYRQAFFPYDTNNSYILPSIRAKIRARASRSPVNLHCYDNIKHPIPNGSKYAEPVSAVQNKLQ